MIVVVWLHIMVDTDPAAIPDVCRFSDIYIKPWSIVITDLQLMIVQQQMLRWIFYAHFEAEGGLL